AAQYKAPPKHSPSPVAVRRISSSPSLDPPPENRRKHDFEVVAAASTPSVRTLSPSPHCIVHRFRVVMADLRSIDPSPKLQIREKTLEILEKEDFSANSTVSKLEEADAGKKCATVEEMGPSRIRELTPEQFCNHGFVIGKASEAGLGNELYKILTAAALSVMLNRGKYPFGDYISYSSVSFTLKEVKHLWKQNRCLTKYGRHLTMRIDDFQKPSRTDVLCSNWREWEQPIIWPEDLQYRANVFGELMRILISPSKDVEKAVNWALSGRRDPDIALHMRMMMNRSVRAKQAAVDCLRKAIRNLPMISKPKVVLVSDTPSMVNNIALTLEEFAEVLHFNYENFEGNISGNSNKLSIINFRTKDWGPAPRWVAFVDFFLASRAKHAVISGAHRRVGTTYAQLIAALAAAYRLGRMGARMEQICRSPKLSRPTKPVCCNACSSTGWWDGLWQSPIPRDAQRMEAYGMKLSGFEHLMTAT
ncbi:hypothetical protein C2S52_023665, partial [Perilla frutescens var. hirtella]